MIRPFSGPQYHDRAFANRQEPCCVCGKGIKDTSKALMAEVQEGGASFVLVGHEPIQDDGGYMGWYYIGPECARLVKAAGAKVEAAK